MTTINGKACVANGRNYYQQNTPAQVIPSPTSPYKPSFTRPDADCPNGFKLTGAQGSTGTVRLNNVITGNGWWTVSFWMRGNQGSAQYLTLDACSLSPVKLTTSADNTWRKYIYTVNITNYGATYNYVDFSNISWAFFLIKDFNVNRGNKPTPYPPEPVDKVFSDGRQVYGRNLIKGSYNCSWSFNSYANTTINKITMDSGEVALHVIGTSDSSGFYAWFTLPSGSNTTSIEVKGTGTVKALGWEGLKYTNMTPTSNWQRVSITNSFDGKAHPFVFYGVMDVYVRLLKAEKSTISTPWTPAPEDVM